MPGERFYPTLIRDRMLKINNIENRIRVGCFFLQYQNMFEDSYHLNRTFHALQPFTRMLYMFQIQLPHHVPIKLAYLP